ncbi:hypothetical protein CONPUDRAFT_77222 [Coniophora puteana RWD-64-598 SS2]|uniref:Uncharacterized protein n=1 Tax=Coniophora puteana (strain RWD-64-598) TaxID=741705 RepID=A0A5M3M9S9_CONPW|nr:uncharacterized protein CONPUDRAFT_77222 [Coniophora puteana RWD-64-598 SS2]EIW75550.1 hypothetical protein CONPUDRAFT_77222 [Coniophora puteana RWD-64-598 SS2]
MYGVSLLYGRHRTCGILMDMDERLGVEDVWRCKEFLYLPERERGSGAAVLRFDPFHPSAASESERAREAVPAEHTFGIFWERHGAAQVQGTSSPLETFVLVRDTCDCNFKTSSGAGLKRLVKPSAGFEMKHNSDSGTGRALAKWQRA